MTSLTEQWKKGELPEGFYYIKVKEVIANYPLLADCVEGLSYTYFLDYEDYVTEVLAPVPSYEEWKEKNEENETLKELLKECQYILKEQNFYRNTPIETDMIYRTRCLKKQELLTKINEALK